jgi:cell division septal protein FtsQ
MARFKRKPKHVESILQALPDFRSGVEKSNRETTNRERRQQRIANSKRLGAFFGVLAIISLLGLGLYGRAVGSVEVTITTNEVGYVPVSEEDVRIAIENYLDESVINNWYVSESVLSERVRRTVPAVAKIELERSGRVLQARIEARQRAVYWQQGDRFYEVDTSGVAFREATREQANSNTLVVDNSRIPVELSQSVAAASTIQYILDFTALVSRQAESSGQALRVQQFLIPQEPREVHLALADKPFTVKMIITQPVAASFAALTDSLKHFEESGVLPEEVVDLRVAGRAAYR